MFWFKLKVLIHLIQINRFVVAISFLFSFIVLDVLKPLQHKRLLEKELEGFGIRLNKEPPQIGFRKKEKGGINLQVLCQQSELDIDLVIICSVYSFYRVILIGGGIELFD